MLRRQVLSRLLAAQSALPGGLRLLVIEAYRPSDVQRSYFEGYRDELHALHPQWSADRLHVEASKYVSPPEVAPHCTAGTVDLTLCEADGVELDMGTEVNASPEASRNACFTDTRSIPAHARRNRAVLVEALTAAGMVNYPTEWWHWSYGDRYWAHATGADTTLFGPIHLARPAGRARERYRRPTVEFRRARQSARRLERPGQGAERLDAYCARWRERAAAKHRANPSAVLSRNATPSVFHQRHIGRVLRSSCNVGGRRVASSCG